MKKVLIAFMMVCLIPAASLASPITVFGPSGTSDKDFFNYLSTMGPVDPYGGERFVAQARIGDAGGKATYEIGLHEPPAFTSAGPIPGGTSQYAWSSGTPVKFSLSRSAGILSFGMGNYYAAMKDDQTDLLAIRFRAPSKSKVGFTNLSWNGVSGVGGHSRMVHTGDDADPVFYWALDQLGVDFSLTGEAFFKWSGTRPKNSHLAFQIKGFDIQTAAPVPEPASMLLLGVGLVGLAGAGRKIKKR